MGLFIALRHGFWLKAIPCFRKQHQKGKFYEHVNNQYIDIGEYHKIIDNVYALKSE